MYMSWESLPVEMKLLYLYYDRWAVLKVRTWRKRPASELEEHSKRKASLMGSSLSPKG